MNIYLLIEDGESFCIKAKTMAEAVYLCEKCYLEDFKDDEKDYEKSFYHENILQSCSMVGPLKN